MIPALLYYGVATAVITVTLWVGFLGWRFYVKEVLRGGSDHTGHDRG